MTDREKAIQREMMIETLRSSGHGYFVARKNVDAENALGRVVDALIEAGYGDCDALDRKWHRRGDEWFRVMATEGQRANTAEHRAEVAERACLIATDKIYDYCYEEAIAQAELELTEEEDD